MPRLPKVVRQVPLPLPSNFQSLAVRSEEQEMMCEPEAEV